MLGIHYGEFIQWMLDRGYEGLIVSPKYHRHPRRWWQTYANHVRNAAESTFICNYVFAEERINVEVALRWGEFYIRE